MRAKLIFPGVIAAGIFAMGFVLPWTHVHAKADIKKQPNAYIINEVASYDGNKIGIINFHSTQGDLSIGKNHYGSYEGTQVPAPIRLYGTTATLKVANGNFALASGTNCNQIFTLQPGQYLLISAILDSNGNYDDQNSGLSCTVSGPSQ